MSGIPNRFWPVLLALLACSLLYRAIVLFQAGALAIWTPWVGWLLVVEFSLIVLTMLSCAWWFARPEPARVTHGLRLTAALIVVHAVRVAIFALGRTGPWADFDLRPEHRAQHAERWTWFDVWFACGMAILSVIVAVVIWRLRRGRRGQR